MNNLDHLAIQIKLLFHNGLKNVSSQREIDIAKSAMVPLKLEVRELETQKKSEKERKNRKKLNEQNNPDK